MTAAIAAFRAGNAPHILQVFEVGTATMMASKGAIKPVGKVMEDAGEKFDPKAYVPAVAGYYTDAERADAVASRSTARRRSSTTTRTPSRPPASTPNKPPKTWPEVVAAAAKLKASGHTCPFTTGWQRWTQLESFSAWHNVRVRHQGERLRRPRRAADVQRPAAGAPHREPAEHGQEGPVRLQRPQATSPRRSSQRRVRDDRRRRPACYGNDQARTPSSSSASRRCRTTPTSPGAPQNTIIGGASLWVMGGKKPDEYKGVAKFFNFLSQPEVQRRATSAPATCRSRRPPTS